MELKATIGAKFKNLWKYYLLQSALATAVFSVLVITLGKENIVLISTMGATAFIVFAMPTTVFAKRKNVIGGHMVGLASGAIFYFTALPYYFEYPLAVGITIFLMVALDVEHPPAAGTALAVVINEITCNTFVTIMISAVVLSQWRYYLRHYLKDLV